jgi:hypothetical protein
VARTIAYAGAIVAEMRGLHDASEDLLHPRTTFRAAEWTSERRQAWIEQARSFDRSRDICSDLNRRIFALRELPLGTDGEALVLRSRLLGLAEEVAHTGQSEASPEELHERTDGLDWHQAADGYLRLCADEFGASWNWSGLTCCSRTSFPR